MPQTNKPKPYLSMAQAAALLGESRTAVYTRAKKYGHINGVAVVLKTPSQMVISRKALEDAIAGETDAPAEKPLPFDGFYR